MGNSISAVEARQHFGEMLSRVVLRQEEIIIERAGKQVARLAPLKDAPPTPRGKLDFRTAAGLGQDVWQGTDVTTFLRQERHEWD